MTDDIRLKPPHSVHAIHVQRPSRGAKAAPRKKHTVERIDRAANAVFCSCGAVVQHLAHRGALRSEAYVAHKKEVGESGHN